MINVLLAIAGTVLASRYVSVDQTKLKEDIDYIKKYISSEKIESLDEIEEDDLE